jgi:DNA-binding transcriptional regulator PaaX
MASQNAPANAKRLLKALIDRANPVAPEGRISQVAADTGLNEGEIRTAIKYAKAQGWFEEAKFGHTRGWLSITPAGKAAAESA